MSNKNCGPNSPGWNFSNIDTRFDSNPPQVDNSKPRRNDLVQRDEQTKDDVPFSYLDSGIGAAVKARMEARQRSPFESWKSTPVPPTPTQTGDRILTRRTVNHSLSSTAEAEKAANKPVILPLKLKNKQISPFGKDNQTAVTKASPHNESMIRRGLEPECNVCLETFDDKEFIRPAYKITAMCLHQPNTCIECIKKHISMITETVTDGRITCPDDSCNEELMPGEVTLWIDEQEDAELLEK